MKKKDGRKISRNTLEWIRIQAVKAVIKEKKSPEKVIETFSLHRSNIYKWIKWYKKYGWKGLKSTKAKGATLKLNKVQIKKIKKWLMKNPQQLHFDFGLWTLNMIQEIVKREFKIKISLATISRLLNKIGYTNQKPLFRAYQQNPILIEQWKKEEYPKIQRKLK